MKSTGDINSRNVNDIVLFIRYPKSEGWFGIYFVSPDLYNRMSTEIFYEGRTNIGRFESLCILKRRNYKYIHELEKAMGGETLKVLSEYSKDMMLFQSESRVDDENHKNVCAFIYNYIEDKIIHINTNIYT